MADNTLPPSPFRRVSNAELADEIGRLDGLAKACEAELKAAKDELKARGVAEATGARFSVTVTKQTANRLDAAALRAFFGKGIARYETAVTSVVVRIKPAVASLAALGLVA
jgi:hypothetical protein